MPFDDGSCLPILPEPVLFNPWKHHLGFIQEKLRTGDRDPLQCLEFIADNVTDLYTGPLSPDAVAREVIGRLRENNALEPAPFAAMLGQHSRNYCTIELSDASLWVLLWGRERKRHVHVHPARVSRIVTRVKGITLKTAIACLKVAKQRNADHFSRVLIDEVRRDLLGLPPVKRVHYDRGIGRCIQLLNEGARESGADIKRG